MTIAGSQAWVTCTARGLLNRDGEGEKEGEREGGKGGEGNSDLAGRREHPAEQETWMKIYEASINNFPALRAEISIPLMGIKAVTVGRKDSRFTSCCFLTQLLREMVQGASLGEN